MEAGLIIYTVMLGIAIAFVVVEYTINRMKDESRLKKWWRENVVGYWNSNHPRVQSNQKNLLYLEDDR